jgi:hypothetical protein
MAIYRVSLMAIYRVSLMAIYRVSLMAIYRVSLPHKGGIFAKMPFFSASGRSDQGSKPSVFA